MARSLIEPRDPAAKKTYDICYAGFRSVLDAIDRDDPAGIASRTGNAELYFEKKLQSAFLGPFLLELKKGGLTLRNAERIDITLGYVQSRMDEEMKPLHQTFLKLLAWENFVEIPAPLVLLANCLQAPRPARFDFEFFENLKGPKHGGPTKLGFVFGLAERAEKHLPGVVTAEVRAMLTELESVFVVRRHPPRKPGEAPRFEGWLRNSVAHCSYLLKLDAKSVYDNKHVDNNGNPDLNYCVSFENVWELYQRALGYLLGFKQAVHQFALEFSGGSVLPDWGPNY